MNNSSNSHPAARQAVIDCISNGQLDRAKSLCKTLCLELGQDADAWLLMAGIYAQYGDLNEVINCCRKVTSLQPDNTVAHYNLGVALQVQGKHAEAEQSYRVIIQTSQNHVPALINLGLVLRNQDKLIDAIQILCEATRIKPDSEDAHYNLGLCYRDLQNFEKASNSFRKALTINPGSAQALCNLGLCLMDQSYTGEAIDTLRKALQLAPDLQDALISLSSGLIRLDRSQEAIEVLQQALVRNPGNPYLHFAIANAHRSVGNHQAAITSYQTAIKINPSFYEAINNLASLLQEGRRFEEAENAYRAALRIRPGEARIHYNLSSVLYEQAKYANALRYGHKAVLTSPDELIFRQHFMRILNYCPPSHLANNVAEEMLRCFSWPGVDYQNLSAPTLSLIRNTRLFQELEALCSKSDLDAVQKSLQKKEFSQLFGHAHLLALLTHTVICDISAELTLTVLRKAFLFMTTEHRRLLTDTEINFIAALACQCGNNEFAYFMDQQESDLVDSLSEFLGDELIKPTCSISSLQSLVATLSMYKPLSEVPHQEELIRQGDPNLLPNIRLLIVRQLVNWKIEQELRTRIPNLTTIQNNVSSRVKNQYEESPYPRWLGVDLLKPTPYKQIFHTLFPGFDPPTFEDEKLNVLIAGCGTGKHAILSKTRFARSEHLAVDLSIASLAYAQRKATDYNLTGLRFMQADILELGSIDQQFHIIESVGVLHHMADPCAGLKILTKLLLPGGLINIGLYSSLARRHVSAARSFYSNQIASLTKDTIRQLRRQIIDLPSNDPIRKVTKTNDFYSLSDCRDLLLHVQEHCFTLPQIDSLLQENNLKFIGFELSDPKVKHIYRNANPQDPSLTSLEHWDRYEHEYPDTFAGMYVFWCQKH